MLGFDIDHCLVKYKIMELEKLLLRCSLEDFREMGYPEEILDFNYEEDLPICMNHAVFDITTGLVIKLLEEGHVS